MTNIQIITRFLARQSGTGNTLKTDGTGLFLFGNRIAEWRSEGLFVTNCGWATRTTRKWLNNLPNVHITCCKSIEYLNGQEWDGLWHQVTNYCPPLDSKTKPVFDLTTRWIPSDGWRGYYQPNFAVAGANNTGNYSDSPCPADVCVKEINAIKQHLLNNGIRTTTKVCETSNVFCVHVYLVAYPKDVEQARTIVTNYLNNNSTELLYSVN